MTNAIHIYTVRSEPGGILTGVLKLRDDDGIPDPPWRYDRTIYRNERHRPEVLALLPRWDRKKKK